MNKKFQFALAFVLMLCLTLIMLSCGNKTEAGEIADPDKDDGGIQVGSGPLDGNSSDDVLDWDDLAGSENTENSEGGESENENSESGSGVQKNDGAVPDDDTKYGPIQTIS